MNKEAKAIVAFAAGGADLKTGADAGQGKRNGEGFDRQPCGEGVYHAREAALIADAAGELLAGLRKTCVPAAFHALGPLPGTLRTLFTCCAEHKARLAECKAWLGSLPEKPATSSQPEQGSGEANRLFQSGQKANAL